MQLKEETDININGADQVFNNRANDIFAALNSTNSENPHFRLPTGPARRSTLTTSPSTSQQSSHGEESLRSRSGSERLRESNRDHHSDRNHPYRNQRSGYRRVNGIGGGGDGLGVSTRAIDRRRTNRTPDHRVHPERWTQYNLESVDENVNNRQIAFDFRNTQAQLRETSSEEVASDNVLPERVLQQDFSTSETMATDHERREDDKFEFRRPSTSQPSTSSSSRNPSDSANIRSGFNTSKLVMPEYQMGMNKKQKEKKRCVSSKIGEEGNKKKSSISLGHLMDEEEEEEDE